jgi:carbonic anhydrase/acetyltransferase-like protein (isoleucine patch superfamily)
MIVRPYGNVYPTIGERVFLAETAAVIGDVVLGDDVSIWYSAVVRGDCNSIRIGARSNVQDGAVIHVTQGTGPTLLEEEVTVGHAAIVHAATVRRGALVGMGSTILDGAEVGESALVAAGSMVLAGTKIPPRTLWAGNPAKLKRELKPEEVEGLKEFWKNYLGYKVDYLAQDAANTRAIDSGVEAGGP